jgi:hypothetical protein
MAGLLTMRTKPHGFALGCALCLMLACGRQALCELVGFSQRFGKTKPLAALEDELNTRQ